jgi:hypothetical protein
MMVVVMVVMVVVVVSQSVCLVHAVRFVASLSTRAIITVLLVDTVLNRRCGQGCNASRA